MGTTGGVSYDPYKYGYGPKAPTGQSIDEIKQKIATDPNFKTSEVQRTQGVITSRKAAGLDTSAQDTYLKNDLGYTTPAAPTAPGPPGAPVGGGSTAKPGGPVAPGGTPPPNTNPTTTPTAGTPVAQLPDSPFKQMVQLVMSGKTAQEAAAASKFTGNTGGQFFFQGQAVDSNTYERMTGLNTQRDMVTDKQISYNHSGDAAQKASSVIGYITMADGSKEIEYKDGTKEIVKQGDVPSYMKPLQAQQNVNGGQTYMSAQQTGGDDPLKSTTGQILTGVQDMIKNAGNDAGTQALIAHWMDSMTATLSQVEGQVLGRLREQMGMDDPATQAALGEIRTQFDQSRKSLLEDLAARGVAQSGVMVETETRLQKGLLSESQKLVAGRLSELQNAMTSAIMQFAQNRLQVSQFGASNSINSNMKSEDRLLQAQQTGLGIQTQLAGMQQQANQFSQGMTNQNQQNQMNRDQQTNLQNNSQSWQTGRDATQFGYQSQLQTGQFQQQSNMASLQNTFARDNMGLAQQYNLDNMGLQNAQQIALQKAGFGHDEDMSKLNFGNQTKLQDQNYTNQRGLAEQGFGFQKDMAGINFGNQQSLQNNAYGWQSQIAGDNRDFQRGQNSLDREQSWNMLGAGQTHDLEKIKLQNKYSQDGADLANLNSWVSQKVLPQLSSGQMTPDAAMTYLNNAMTAAAQQGNPWSEQQKVYAATLVQSYADWAKKNPAAAKGGGRSPNGPSGPMGTSGSIPSSWGKNYPTAP